ncbi:hypothetical protein BCR34DRAFT_25701 [Clohesyomyces aquaticus]|uniref:NYN domain-containing protein n=1 Tax=Clohesyomyces aquaticus TaxID=1231657 RepID=A0A1Y1ZAY4_9PLEO|nr:hypothetical protein BCR34DRAFT_25701 [Clohesyomyces aquaticus]
MPSEPDDTSWGFGPALDLIGGFNTLDGASVFKNYAPDPTDSPEPSNPTAGEDDAALDLAGELPKLGDFSKIFDTLGVPRHAPSVAAEPEDFDTDASYHSDEPLSSPPAAREADAPERHQDKIDTALDDFTEIKLEPKVESPSDRGEPNKSPIILSRPLSKKEAKKQSNRLIQEANRLRNIEKREGKKQKPTAKQEKKAARKAQKALEHKVQEQSPTKDEPKQNAKTQGLPQLASGLIPSMIPGSVQIGQVGKATVAKPSITQEKTVVGIAPLAQPSPLHPGLLQLSTTSPDFIPQPGAMDVGPYFGELSAGSRYGGLPTPTLMGLYDQYRLSAPLTPGNGYGYGSSQIPTNPNRPHTQPTPVQHVPVTNIVNSLGPSQNPTYQNGLHMQSTPVHHVPVANVVNPLGPSFAPGPDSYVAAIQQTSTPMRYNLRSNSSAKVHQLPTTPLPGAPTLGVSSTPAPHCTSRILNTRSGEDRHEQLFLKIMRNFPDDKKWMVAPMQLSNNGMVPGGIHVIVDASNILIGFQEVLRQFRESLKQRGIRRVDISFDSLILLLERRRPVAKRVLAGSTKSAPPLPAFQMAKAVGYEVNIMERVLKTKELTDRDLFFQDVDTKGWDAAIKSRQSKPDESDSETGAFVATPQTIQKWVEQGVDELLHLKMLESVVDCWQAPSTMVIATGDAAPAEYSGGFMAQMERVLERGWKVELVSWRRQTSAAYRKPKFLKKWEAQFRIIELDEYLEELLDI